MSFRKNLNLTSGLLIVALCGVSGLAGAAAASLIADESCVRTTVVSSQRMSHPGKSVLLPKRSTSVVAQCPEERKPLILASYTDARGGQALVRGNTQRALKQIGARRAELRNAAELTNLCAAYTVLRQFAEASNACDAAVASAMDERARAQTRLDMNRRAAEINAGAAYSNRAVLHWLSGDETAAHNDLVKASNFTPAASYVVRNLEVAERSPSLARSAQSSAQSSTNGGASGR
jgi:hypothetical protein